MALDDNDLEKIGQIVNKEIGSLRLEMNQRFDQADSKNTKEHQEIIQKIEQVKQMETEDVQAIAADVMILKKKMAI